MDKKGILLKIKELFTEQTETKMGMDYRTLDGRIIRCYGEGLEIGDDVKEITPDGEMDLIDGEYTLEDGMTLTIADSKIMEVAEVNAEDGEDDGEDDGESFAEYLETELMDGTKVRVEGNELVVGAKVEVETPEGWVPAPEGQHNLADDRVIYVDAEGKVNEIQTPDTKKEDEVGMEQLFSSIESLVNEVKGMRSIVEGLKLENEELKTRFNKFAEEPSVEPIKKTIDLKSNNKEDKLKFFANR
jgi:hypothetical protein